jgi:hypothetical protein
MEDTKGPPDERQYNGQNNKDKNTNIDLENSAQKTGDRVL